MRLKQRYGIMAAILAGVTFSALLIAQDMMDDEEMHGGKPEKTKEADAQYKANLKKYKGNPDVLVLPGLVADRKAKQVDTLCETTSLEARNSAEYLIVDQRSSHGYEAMLWSFASPSDIHKGLAFIGMRAGAPVNPGDLRFWSKGERVTASVLIDDEPVPIEDLILDTETETTLPHEGWIFTGSMMIPNPTGGTERIYLADHYDPRSVIPAYNEIASVLDPPWTAPKGQFYDSHVASPDFAVKPHSLVTVRYEPQMKNGKTRIRDLVLDVTDKMTFHLKDPTTGKPLSKEPTFEAAIKVCRKLIEEDREPCLTVNFDHKLTLEQIQPVCQVLLMIDGPSGVRIEPPAAHQIFYRAFLPNRRWLDPQERFEQPWELHLDVNKSSLSGTMVMYDTHWKSGQTRPDLTKRSYKVSTAKDVCARLDKEVEERKQASRRHPPAALLVFVPKDLPYGTLVSFIAPAMETYNTVHLFLREEEKPTPPPDHSPTNSP